MFDYFVPLLVLVTALVMIAIIVYLAFEWRESVKHGNFLVEELMEHKSMLRESHRNLYYKDREILNLKNQIAALEVRNEQQT